MKDYKLHYIESKREIEHKKENRKVKKHLRTKGIKKPQCCPYCGAEVIRAHVSECYLDTNKVNADYYIYMCSNYPECDAYIKENPKLKIPQGSLANKNLRELRQRAHYFFNQLYLYEDYKIKDAYMWLASEMNLDGRECHISLFDEAQCLKCIELTKDKLICNHEIPYGEYLLEKKKELRSFDKKVKLF